MIIGVVILIRNLRIDLKLKIINNLEKVYYR